MVSVSPSEEMVAGLIRDWLPFSSQQPSSSNAIFSNAVVINAGEGADVGADADDEMEMDTDTETEMDSDPGVSETVFDWTEFLSVIPSIEDTCPYRTHYQGVITTIDIPSGVYIGNIAGERKYIWEVQPDAYDKIIWVFEDCVIDCSDPSKCNRLSYVREGYYEGFNVNCKLVSYTDYSIDNDNEGDGGDCRVGLESIRPIKMGEELIYWHPEMV